MTGTEYLDLLCDAAMLCGETDRMLYVLRAAFGAAIPRQIPLGTAVRRIEDAAKQTNAPLYARLWTTQSFPNGDYCAAQDDFFQILTERTAFGVLPEPMRRALLFAWTDRYGRAAEE